MKPYPSPSAPLASPCNPTETPAGAAAPTLYLALGSNLGDRTANIEKAIARISERIGEVSAFSGCFETMPVGFVSDHAFCNAAIAVNTSLDVQEILFLTQEIERELGRTQKSEKGIYHDRIIDIDLLFYGKLTVHTENISLPHPHLHERRFVLEPLCRIAPALVHPAFGKSVSQMLKELNTGCISEVLPAQCTPSLLDAINQLLPQLWDEAPLLTAERLLQLAQAENVHLYTLCDEQNQVCGMATLAVDSLPTGTKAWIEDVVVEKASRNRGYGKQLIEHLIAEARRLHVQSLNLTSRPERKAANALYQSLGFEQRNTNVYKMSF